MYMYVYTVLHVVHIVCVVVHVHDSSYSILIPMLFHVPG